ncbi:MAG TPA: hypothetical protein VHU86_09115 [Solirubrobacterales bacterium]|jgi:predicted transcriptional regulator|nr:hypothetical protein [Solirubrobacterales bacterium]
MARPHRKHQPSPEQELPKRLASKLSADLRPALQHPCRRQILRSLHNHVHQKLNPAEAAESGLLPCSTPCANYHMRVLAKARLVGRASSEASRGSIKVYFSSLIGEKPVVLEVLRETEESDSRFLAQPAARNAV